MKVLFSQLPDNSWKVMYVYDYYKLVPVKNNMNDTHLTTRPRVATTHANHLFNPAIFYGCDALWK